MSSKTTASTSDKPAARGFIPPQNDDERRLMCRTEEICRTAVSRGISRYTGFLSDREQALTEAACRRAECDCFRFDGGYADAERCVLCVEPHGSRQQDPLAFLRLTALAVGAEKLPSHRDYLGAILGLGLERACIGDLLPDPENTAVFYAIVLAEKAELIARELISAGRCSVHAEQLEALPARLAAGVPRLLQEATVSSLRADAVLAAMLHTSRTQAASYIAAGRVEINHLPLRAAHEAVYAGDIFTVRGIGRWRFAELGGKSKKDRLFISFYQY